VSDKLVTSISQCLAGWPHSAEQQLLRLVAKQPLLFVRDFSTSAASLNGLRPWEWRTHVRVRHVSPPRPMTCG
jgi:hypothetical protein